METLKINIPKGFKIGTFNQKTGEVSFEPLPKDIKELIRTFKDVLEYHNMDIHAFNNRVEYMTDDEAAYVKVKLIAKALNEGWTPDWTNSNEYKYYPWFEMGSPSGVGFSFGDCDRWLSSSIVGSRLCFKSRELAVYAGKQFENIYKEFLTLN